MRNTAVTVLILCVAACVAAPGAQSGSGRDPGRIAITAAPVPLNPGNPSQSSIGPFTYVGGLVLSSSQTDRFHELSDLALTGADHLTAVGDGGVFVTMRLLLDAAQPILEPPVKKIVRQGGFHVRFNRRVREITQPHRERLAA